MSKPTIVLVPGAWHPPSAFSPLTEYLKSHSYDVHAIALPSVNSSPPQPDFTADVTAIASTLSTLADSGKDIVLLTHSYGGVPGSSACKGLLKSQRSSGGVVHIIYCASFALPLGVSLMDALNHTPLPWFKFASDDDAAHHSERRSQLNITPATPNETFYNSLPAATGDKLTKTLGTQSYGAMWSGVTFAAWDECPCTYVLCGKDEAIPVQGQAGMCDAVDGALKDGRTINRVTLEEADHTPFWSETEKLGEAVRRCAGEKV